MFDEYGAICLFAKRESDINYHGLLLRFFFIYLNLIYLEKNTFLINAYYIFSFPFYFVFDFILLDYAFYPSILLQLSLYLSIYLFFPFYSLLSFTFYFSCVCCLHSVSTNHNLASFNYLYLFFAFSFVSFSFGQV